MVGIVIPAYKRKECLRKTLISLTLQTKQSFYVVVVDDCSPEPLKDVAEEFNTRLHIKYIYLEKNGGPGLARQAGLNYCYEKNFEFVVFLDSDDYLMPHGLARLNHEINISGADVVSSSIFCETSPHENKIIDANNKTFVHGKIYRTSFLKKNNIKFPSIRTNEDLAFNLSAMELSNNVKLLDEVLHLFRKDQNSITRCGKNALALEVNYIDAIYYSSAFLVKHNKLTEQMIMNIFSCYNRYQRALLLGWVPSIDEEKRVRWIFSLTPVKEKLNDAIFMSHLINSIQQAMFINNKVENFKQDFRSWIKEYII